MADGGPPTLPGPQPSPVMPSVPPAHLPIPHAQPIVPPAQ